MRLLLCLFALGCALPACAAQPAAPAAFQPAQLRDFPRSQLTIERRTGRDTFQIWLAETPRPAGAGPDVDTPAAGRLRHAVPPW